MLIPARTREATAARTEPFAWISQISPAIWLLTGLTVLGAVLRLATVSHQSFWLDEALAARDLHLSFGAMLRSVLHGEPNPPLYFVLAWPWAKVFGTSEAGIRSLSVLAGTALIPIAYLCGRDLVSRRAGLLAAAFVSLSPFMIWYSQEAREYMLLALLCAVSFLFFSRLWQGPSRGNLIWWATFSALALVTHYFAAFVVWPEAAALLFRQRKRSTVLAVAVLAVVEIALLPHFFSHEAHPAGWIGAFPLSVRIKQIPVAFALGSLYQSSSVTYGLLAAAAVAAIVIALLVIGARSDELRGAGFAAAFGGIVIAIPLLVAVFGHDYIVPRALIAAWVPLAVVLAAACTSIRTRQAGAALAALTLAAFVYAGLKIDNDSKYQRPNWRGVAVALGTPTGPRAIVAYDGGFAAVPLALYLGGDALNSANTTPIDIGEIDVVGNVYQRTATTLPTGVHRISSKTVDGYLVQRFSLPAPTVLSPAQIGSRAEHLLGPAAPGGAVVIQRTSA